MKKFPKILIALLALAIFVSIFAAMPALAAAEYQALRLKTAQLTVGHYNTLDMTGEIIQHSANKNYKEEVGCLVDNDNKGGYWSKPYKFSALKDNGGTTIPVILIDVAAGNNGEPVTIAGFEMLLRTAFDCQPLHFELQVTTDASNNWISILDKKLKVEDWVDRKMRFEFSEVTVYKLRMLTYDIADADAAADEYKDYDRLKGDETRFTLGEVDILQKVEGSGSTTTPNQKPTTSVQPTTRPSFTRPVATSKPTTPVATTKPTTPVATTKPTSPVATTKPTTPVATAKPTTPVATAKPTTPVATAKPTTPVATAKPTTPVATAKPTTAPTQVVTTPVTAPIGVTEPTTLVTVPTETLPIDVTEPSVDATIDPSAPTEDVTIDPSAPTEDATIDPSAPTEPVTEPEATEPEATEPEATTAPTTDTDDGAEKPDNTALIIIIAIVAVAALAGGLVFFIIRKKKNA